MVNKTKRPSKQKKRFFGAKMHELQKHMHSTLSKELRKSLKTRALGVRKEDKVKVMRGKFKGKNGKVTGVNREKRQVFVEGVMRKKADGKEIFVPIHPSNLMIMGLAAGDKKRGAAALGESMQTGEKQVEAKKAEKNENAVLAAKAR
ncbi:MAG: 50S ribosomal protein L24 [archaeon]